MGGFGSGRPGWHMKAEHCRSLDVNRLHKAGCLWPGRVGRWEWRQDGEVVASLGLRGTDAGLRLIYRKRQAGKEGEDIDYTVPITWVPCTKGGTRPYFRCPGVRDGQPCGRRVAKLYAGGRYFLCRHCYRLTYQSRSEPRYDRLLRRANKLHQAIDAEPGTEGDIPPRPKGQWRKTYDAKLEAIWTLEEEADREFARLLAQRFPGVPLTNI